MSEYRLTTEIIERSEAANWDQAKLEWGLAEVYQADEPETCLCGHFPIVELCVLRNKLNASIATVGNCCVKKFLGLPSDLIFQAVKRVRADNDKSLNGESIEHAFGKGWINQWERDFYFQVMRKRKLSDKQASTKRSINLKMMRNMRRIPPSPIAAT
ncbi:hypothetical protein OX462_12315 [Janthinobacterium sp. SUN098]|uniref:hypothetical protein n=1 Tax=Janthinobacterium sp. SUN098 TaxID=3002437 RepID=UPI0038D3D43F